MKYFDWKIINSTCDAREIAVQYLGMKCIKEDNEAMYFNCPWRAGSDSGAFKVFEHAWIDHASPTKERGSVLDLVARVKFGGDIWEAQAALGEYLHLKPSGEAKSAAKIVKVYDYHDASGNVVHQTIRYDPKGFKQRRPDPDNPGEYIWSLKGIVPVLYRLRELAASPWVCVVGGEKDADNLAAIGIPATTNPMGEGNWAEHYNEFFRGKFVNIIPDLDREDNPVGMKHAQTVAFNLKGVAKEIRIVKLPFPAGVTPAKDASDWIAWKRSVGDPDATIAEGFKALFRETKALNGEKLELPKETQQELTAIQRAKNANKRAISNYDWGVGESECSKPKDIRIARHVTTIVEELPVRFLGFPCRVGTTLFDHDKDDGQINLFESPPKLMEWIMDKSKQGKEWTRADNFVTEREFFDALCRRMKRYEAISGVPNWPIRNDVYYTFRSMPVPDPKAALFLEFCQMFSPASETDWHLLRAFVASPLYYKGKVKRPVWVIDSKDGQGSGKTTLGEMVALLYGGDDVESGEPTWISAEKLNNEMMMDRVLRELLSGSGRKKRMVIVDNVVGYFKCPELARLVTQSSLTGLAPYGHTQETRPNDLTWVITSNSATVDKDLSDRSLFLKLCKSENREARWTKRVTDFIAEHRLQIISDIMGILDRGPQWDYSKPRTRFEDWEYDVLVPILGDRETWESVTLTNAGRQHESDGDVEDAAMIRDILNFRVSKALGDGWETKPVWLHTSVVTSWVFEGLPKFGGGSVRGCAAALRNMIKTGALTDLSTEVESWPRNGRNRHRGFMWNIESYHQGNRVMIIGQAGDGSHHVNLTPLGQE